MENTCLYDSRYLGIRPALIYNTCIEFTVKILFIFIIIIILNWGESGEDELLQWGKGATVTCSTSMPTW